MWNQTYGGSGYDKANALVATSDGGYALAGSTASFGAGSSDFWLVKTDAQGNMEWNKTYGGINQEVAFALVETSDGGYALAGVKLVDKNHDFWLVKTDALGDMEWNQTYGEIDGDDRAMSLIETSDGGYALAGFTTSFNSSAGDAWLIKTDAYGKMEWNKTIGGETMEWANALIENDDGGYALAGYKFVDGEFYDFWLVKTDEFGNAEWTQTYAGPRYDVAYALVATSDGGYALAGYKESGDNYLDFCLIKTDATGNMEWTKTYGNDVTDIANSVVETSDGGYILAGATKERDLYTDPNDGKADCWIIKTDLFGNVEWSQIYGGNDTESAESIVQTSDGGYAFAGSTLSFGVGGADFWLIKTDEYGYIPEFPLWSILPLVLTITLFSLIIKRNISKRERNRYGAKTS